MDAAGPTGVALPAGATKTELPSGRARETCLWLIRHAEVEVRYHSIFGGRIDMNLSPRGSEQAVALAKYLKNQSFGAVYASPMKRVQQTLRPVLDNGLPEPKILPGLREVDFGDWTGLSWDEVKDRFGVPASAWLDQLECGGIPSAEAAGTLRARVKGCLEQIVAEHPGQDVAVFCHGGVIRVVLAMLLALPLPKLAAVEIDYASITKIGLREIGPELRLANFAPWRDLP